MGFNVVAVPLAYMRSGHAESEKVVSQVILGEEVQILEQSTDGEWDKIKTADGYVGWIQVGTTFRHVTPYISEIDMHLKVTSLMAHMYSVMDTEWGERSTAFYGSRLKIVGIYLEKPRWIKVQMPNLSFTYIQRGDVDIDPKVLPKEKVIDLAKRFLGVPFSWGGRSSFGVDSSGFSQLLCREMGVTIPRDAKDQCVSDKFKTIEWEQKEPGDFIFFGTAEDKVKQVGMYVGEEQIINSTVRNLRTGVSIQSLKDSPWDGREDLIYRIAKRLIMPK